MITPSSLTFTELFSKLISLPSVSCTSPAFDQSNLPVIELLAAWLEDLGFSTEVLPVPNQPAKANLIATLGSGPGGLVLAGHTDTVPYNENRWDHNPLALTEKDGRLYGLGTCDMKGFFPLAIEAVKPFLETELKQPLIILATADEESSMSGAQALADAGMPQARYAVIGEPTNMKPVRMHKGMMMEAVRIQGLAGHSSNPDLGNSALEAMHQVMSELIQLRSELQQQYQNPCFDVPVPTLNLGCIHGGDNPNRICSSCELHFDLRPLPGMHLEELRSQINSRLQPIATQHKVALSLEPLFGGASPFQLSQDADFVSVVEKLTGHSAEAVNFATEAPFLQQLGMDTIVLGPGDIAQAHQPDEYLSIDRINPTIDVLSSLIKHYCL